MRSRKTPGCFRGVLLIVTFCACWESSLAQIASRPAGEWIRTLESPGRIEGLRIPEVVAALQLQKPSAVADIGAGSGVFSRPLANEIYPATLYAVDIDPDLLRHIESTCKGQGIDNVRTVLAVADDPKLPEKVDLIFLCDTLHHIANPDSYVTKLPKYLESGGRVAVIDFLENWPPGHEAVRFAPEQLESWMAAAGLRKIKDLKIPKNAFFHIYVKQ